MKLYWQILGLSWLTYLVGIVLAWGLRWHVAGVVVLAVAGAGFAFSLLLIAREVRRVRR